MGMQCRDGDSDEGRELTPIMSCKGFFGCILAPILPPLGVLVMFGCNIEICICLVLTILGYLPGIIFAVWVIITCSPRY